MIVWGTCGLRTFRKKKHEKCFFMKCGLGCQQKVLAESLIYGFWYFFHEILKVSNHLTSKDHKNSKSTCQTYPKSTKTSQKATKTVSRTLTTSLMNNFQIIITRIDITIHFHSLFKDYALLACPHEIVNFFYEKYNFLSSNVRTFYCL